MTSGKKTTVFLQDYFDLIVVDEAHHCMSDSYQRILAYFDTAKVLGVTATPDRADQKSLGQFFDSKAFEYEELGIVIVELLDIVDGLFLAVVVGIGSQAIKENNNGGNE